MLLLECFQALNFATLQNPKEQFTLMIINDLYTVFPRIAVHELIYETPLFFRAKNLIRI